MFGDVNDSVRHFLFFCARNMHAVEKSHSQVAKQPGSQAARQILKPKNSWSSQQPDCQKARRPDGQVAMHGLKPFLFRRLTTRIETMSIWQINRSGQAFLRNEQFTRRKGVCMQLCTTSYTNNTHIKRIKYDTKILYDHSAVRTYSRRELDGFVVDWRRLSNSVQEGRSTKQFLIFEERWSSKIFCQCRYISTYLPVQGRGNTKQDYYECTVEKAERYIYSDFFYQNLQGKRLNRYFTMIGIEISSIAFFLSM